MQSIVTCGIPRSGSTLVWQILQAIFPQQNILKTHPDIWEPDGSTAVVSIRHPHDVVASLFRVRLSRAGKDEGDQDDLTSVIKRTVISFKALHRIKLFPHVFLRYEDFFNDHYIIFAMIQKTFGVVTPLYIQRRISDKYSVTANRRRATKLKDFNAVDKNQIHGDHIGMVTPGYWSSALPEWTLNQVIVECCDIVRGWGYA